MAGREDLRSMQDAWRAYLDLALGLTETSRKRATKVAKKLVGRGGATAEQLQTMAEDLLSTSLANREAMTRLVRFELDKALGRVGLATADEVTELTTRVRELEEELKAARAAQAAAGPIVVPSAVAAAGPVKAVRKVAKKAVAKKAAPVAPGDPATPSPVKAGSRGGARKASAIEPVVKVSPARVVAKRAGSGSELPVKKVAVKKVAVKKAVAKKAAVRKTALDSPFGDLGQGQP